MPRAIISGSCGLVGSAAAKKLLRENWEVVGIDNNSRAAFFGQEASTSSVREELAKFPKYEHYHVDITNAEPIYNLVSYGADLIIHAAAQPAHDWATANIRADFNINALGTLNMLEAWKDNCPKAPFCHISTSKIYGDNPNKMKFEELPTRWEPFSCGIGNEVKYNNLCRHNFDVDFNKGSCEGIPEDFPVDNSLHSFFGVSKLSGDLLVQEYGKYFGLPSGVFRPGCVVGGQQKGAELHGFLSYLAKCVRYGRKYRIYGYGGRQVRDNLHANDLVEAMLLFANNPKPGEVWNIGGRGLDCSMMEAIVEFEKRGNCKLDVEYVETPRTGDHRWWISDTRKLQRDYGWKPNWRLCDIYDEIWEMA